MDKIESSIKKFFSKKKTEAKFKMAGPGRKLTDTAAPSTSQSSTKKSTDVYVPIKRNDLTNEAKMARDAALARVTKTNVNTPMNFSLKAIREQAKKEMEEQRNYEKHESVENTMKHLTVEDDGKSDYTVDGVFFGCPLISDEILSKKEWTVKIKSFLYEQQLAGDPGLAACLIIKNCNTLDRAEDCIETIKKYLNNIIANPSEEKFHKIRMSNRIFSEKVANIEGSREFMQAAGFTEQTMEDGEKYYIWSKDFPIEMLIQLHEALDLCEVIQLELDRNIRVLLPSQIQKVSLPPDFFRVTMEELKREQQSRMAAMEESLILKTKAMREKEQERYANRFKYSLIRIRFPDGLYLQGTFGVHEKLGNVFEFIAASLHHETAEFSLIAPDGEKLSNEDSEKTLHSLRLVPNVILKFAFEGASSGLQEYLKEELLMLASPM